MATRWPLLRAVHRIGVYVDHETPMRLNPGSVSRVKDGRRCVLLDDGRTWNLRPDCQRFAAVYGALHVAVSCLKVDLAGIRLGIAKLGLPEPSEVRLSHRTQGCEPEAHDLDRLKWGGMAISQLVGFVEFLLNLNERAGSVKS